MIISLRVVLQIGFSVFIVIWAIVMLEYWKRKEKLTALYWGMIGFEKNEVTRPGIFFSMILRVVFC